SVEDQTPHRAGAGQVEQRSEGTHVRFDARTPAGPRALPQYLAQSAGSIGSESPWQDRRSRAVASFLWLHFSGTIPVSRILASTSHICTSKGNSVLLVDGW